MGKHRPRQLRWLGQDQRASKRWSWQDPSSLEHHREVLVAWGTACSVSQTCIKMAPFLILSLSSLWSPLACIPAQPPQDWAPGHHKDPFSLAIFPQWGNCITNIILSVPKHLPRLPRALRSPHVAWKDLSNSTRLPHHPQPLLGTAGKTPCGSPPPRKLLHTLQGPNAPSPSELSVPSPFPGRFLGFPPPAPLQGWQPASTLLGHHWLYH